jgi:hypothetical protein
VLQKRANKCNLLRERERERERERDVAMFVHDLKEYTMFGVEIILVT